MSNIKDHEQMIRDNWNDLDKLRCIKRTLQTLKKQDKETYERLGKENAKVLCEERINNLLKLRAQGKCPTRDSKEVEKLKARVEALAEENKRLKEQLEAMTEEREEGIW